jgi:recombination protein U
MGDGKVFYPTGQKEVYKKTYINYGNRGMSLESLINSANEYYLEKDKAVIYKKPTPIGIVDVDYKKNEIKKAYFKDKSTFDYNGIYKGKYIDFEAKESRIKTSFPLSNIHPHQIEHLKHILHHGGIAFLIVYIDDVYYLLKGEDLLEFLDNNTRKSIPIEFFKEKCFKIEEKLRPTLDYLSVVDEIYFKGEN